MLRRMRNDEVSKEESVALEVFKHRNAKGDFTSLFKYVLYLFKILYKVALEVFKHRNAKGDFTSKY